MVFYFHKTMTLYTRTREGRCERKREGRRRGYKVRWKYVKNTDRKRREERGKYRHREEEDQKNIFTLLTVYLPGQKPEKKQ